VPLSCPLGSVYGRMSGGARSQPGPGRAEQPAVAGHTAPAAGQADPDQPARQVDPRRIYPPRLAA
jgi:hypothetical protein